jgi:hypothetical protein
VKYVYIVDSSIKQRAVNPFLHLNYKIERSCVVDSYISSLIKRYQRNGQCKYIISITKRTVAFLRFLHAQFIRVFYIYFIFFILILLFLSLFYVRVVF